MKTINIVLAVLFMSYYVSAQQPYESFHITFNGSGAFPVGSFKTAVAPNGGVMGIGGGFSALFNLKGKHEYFPLFLGADYLSFGRDKLPETEYLQALKTTFNFYGISAIGRVFLSAKKSGLVPFIDGQAGLNIIKTNTMVDRKMDLADLLSEEESPEVLNTTNDLGLMYGASLGFYTRKLPNKNNNRSPSFFMKAGYMSGDNIDHVKRGTVKVINGIITYQTTNSSVNNIFFQFGFVFPN
jgi:hypothetical protein